MSTHTKFTFNYKIESMNEREGGREKEGEERGKGGEKDWSLLAPIATLYNNF